MFDKNITVEDIKMKLSERVYKRCIDIGMKFEDNALENYKDGGCYYITEYLHAEMKKKICNKQFVPNERSWAREFVFFKRHTSNINSNFYIDESDLVPSVEKVINIKKKVKII